MGLDSVELMIEVEDAFGVQIPDDRGGEMYTVGDVYDFILECKRDADTPRNVCLSAATFFMIRRALAGEMHLAAQPLRPRALVAQTLPVQGRRALWAELQNTLGLKFPKLSRPKWLVTLSSLLTAAAALAIAAIAHQEVGSYAGPLAGLLSVVAFGLVAARITEPLAVHPRPGWTSFRGLTHVVLAHNYGQLSEKFNSWQPADVWSALRTIVVEQLGVKPEQVTKQALLIEDLGAG
ncbi:MAG: hypothetical protein ABGZ17_11440 [Planctomycetaceae bacterium]